MNTGKNEERVLWFLLGALILCHVLYFNQSLPHMVPNPAGRSDEVDYFTDAKSFCLSGSINGTVSLDENVSKIGECGAHGFAYALFYGTIGKILRGSDLMLPLGNLASLLLVLFYLYWQPFSTFSKNSISVLVLSYFITVIFLQAFMVEVLNISIALFLSLYLFRLVQSDEKDRSRRSWFFLIFILLAASFRFTFIFFLLGLLPLATDRKAFAKYVAMFILSSLYAMFFINNFIAPFGFHPDSATYLLLHGGDDKFSLAATQIAKNIKSYFHNDPLSPEYHYQYKYVLVILPLLQAYFYARTREKMYLIPLFISVVYLVFICVLNNNVYDLNDLRPLSAVFVLNVVFFVLSKNNAVSYTLITLAVLSFPAIHEQVENNVAHVVVRELEILQRDGEDGPNHREAPAP